MPYKDKDKQNAYLKDRRHRFTMNLMLTTDSDIIEWINGQPSKQGAVKDAIRYYIAKIDK